MHCVGFTISYFMAYYIIPIKVNFWSLSTFFSETIRVSEMKQIALDAESFRDGFKAR